MADDSTVRTFLAAELPADVLQGMARVQSRLKKTLSGPIRWVRPAGIHLTLRFLGDLSPERIPEILAAVEPSVTGTAPIPLTVRGLGVFPHLTSPRVLWMGLEGETTVLESLRHRIEEAVVGMGFAREERTFRAHLTLARIKSAKGLIGMAAAVESQGGETAGSFTVTALHLFQSALTPQGAVYTKLATFPF
jgi:2'-5' RNA ligase